MRPSCPIHRPAAFSVCETETLGEIGVSFVFDLSDQVIEAIRINRLDFVCMESEFKMLGGWFCSGNVSW